MRGREKRAWQKSTCNKKELEQRKEHERLRKRLQRQKRKAALLSKPDVQDNKLNISSMDSKSPYSCKQALGKAISKVRKCLPSSPRKAIAVVSTLASNFGLTPPTSCNRPTTSITQECLDSVYAFYLRDDISRQCPGRKDSVIVRNGNTKETLQKRHLLLSILECYSLFKESHAGMKIGKSKFAECRPKQVLLMSQIPQNVCICQHHVNISLLLAPLSGLCPLFPNHHNNLIKALVCNPNNECCMFGSCETCNLRQKFHLLVSNSITDDQRNEHFSWFQWVKDCEGKTVKVLKEGTAFDIIQLLESQLQNFLRHCFVKSQQSLHFQQLQQNVTGNNVLMQIDFSENFTILQQHEVQSAHWTNDQVRLYTAVVWSLDRCHILRYYIRLFIT